MPSRSVVYSFIGNFSSLNAGLAAAGRNTAELGAKLTALDRNGVKMRSGLTALGGTAGKVGLVAAAGLGVAIFTAAKFDKAMSSVQAATHETASSMEDLRAAALKAGADTAYSATEAAGAIEELAKAGVSTSDILDGGLTGSLNLAAAGAIDVADAAEIAATAMTQFKLGGDQVEHVADLLSAGAGKAQGSVDDLGMALKQGGLVASQTGLSIEETVGTLSAFASAGLIGSDAGTSFKTMLQSLTPSSVKAKEEMERLGISAYDAQGNFIGMTEFAGQLQGALSTLTVEQQNAALKTIFGADAVRAASVIYDQGADGIQSWIDKTNDSGYAAETAATRMDNLSGDLEKLKGSLETALIGAGDGSQGPLRQLVQGADDVVNAFNKLPGSAQNVAVGLAAITAVTGGGLWFGAKVIGGIANTKQALDDLGYSSGRVGRNLKIVGGLGAAATVLTAIGVAAQEVAKQTDDAAPNVEALTKSLLGLDSATQVEALVGQLGDLRGAMDSLDDPNFAQDVYKFYDSIPLGVGSITNSLIPGLTGAGQESREAAASLQSLDDALAGIVNEGSPEQAAEVFNKLADTYRLTAEQQETLRGLLPGYQEALDGAANSATLAADAQSDLGPAGKVAADGMDEAAAAADKAADQLKKAQDAARETARGFITLGDSLSDGKKSLGQWTRELEQQAQALRDFTANARTAAKRGLDDGLIKSLNEAGPAGALRMKQLANATDAEIKRANKAWREGQAAIREYVNMQVPPKKIEVDSSPALAAIARIKRELATIPRSIRTMYYVTQVNSINKRNAGGGMDGDPSTPWASGGYTGDGGKFEPRGIVHAGEVVLPQSIVKRDWPMLASRYGHLPGFASGGMVGSTYARTSTNLPDAADAAANSLFNLAGLGKRELEIRSRLLNKEVERDQKAADAARDHRNAVLDDMKSLKESIAGRFKSDLFGRDLGFGAESGISSAALAQMQATSVVNTLQSDIAEAREARRLYAQLRAAGLNGAALTYAQQNASNGELAALLNDPTMLRQYGQLYGTRERVSAGTGQTAAMQRYGNALDRSNAHLADVKAELRESKQALHRLEKRQERMEKLAQSNPRETGDAVGDVVQRTASTASRRH